MNIYMHDGVSICIKVLGICMLGQKEKEATPQGMAAVQAVDANLHGYDSAVVCLTLK